jgi:hypothetical protein
LSICTLPAAKISAGADADTFLEQQHDGVSGMNDISSHDYDRDNLMMMNMMNSPHEPIPLDFGAGWCNPFIEPPSLVDTLHGVSTISDYGSTSGCSSECSDDEVHNQASDTNPHDQETDLREFLMETFEDVNVMDYTEDLAPLAI